VFTDVAAQQGIRLVVSGPGLFGVQSRQVISRESMIFSIAATMLVGLILLAGYRSGRLLAVGALPLVSALLAGACLVSLVYGSIHGITLAFGITLLGVTMDYPIHLFSHMEPDKSVAGSMIGIWPTIRLGAVTTSIGFLAMMTTSFSGLAQLGLFAVAGIIAAALTTRFVLPSLLHFPGKFDNRLKPGGCWQSLLQAGQKLLLPVLLLGGLGIIVIAFFPGPVWENDLAGLSPIPRSLIEQDRQFREWLHAPEVSHMVVIRGDHAQDVLEHCESLDLLMQSFVNEGLIKSYDSVCRYLPSKKRQLQNRKMLPDQAVLKKNLSEALVGLPFKKEFFAPFEEDILAAKTLAPLGLDDLQGTKIALRLHSQLFAVQEGWLGVIPLSGVRDGGLLEQRFLGIGDHDVLYLNLKKESNTLLADFRSAALSRLMTGVVFLLAALVLGLRSVTRALRVLLPVFLALSVDVALLLLLGERLSLFHLVSILLVLGITLDYSLFFNRENDTQFFRLQTLHSLTICCLSTISLFGLLAFSSLPVLDAIGKTVAMGVVVGYFFSLALARHEENRT